MFFLKQTDGEQFAFTSPEQSSMPMPRARSSLSVSSDSDLYAKVLRHLGQELLDDHGLSQDRIRTIFVIDSEQSSVVSKMFKDALDSPAARSDAAFRFELLAALVRHKDVSVLSDLETALLTNHDVALNQGRGNMIYALQQINPSQSGPILIQALKLPEPQLRAAAAAALGSVRSDEATRALFDALDDPDPEVKGSVVNSLTGIFHAPQCLPTGYAPADSFDSCVEHWKEFAVARNLHHAK